MSGEDVREIRMYDVTTGRMEAKRMSFGWPQGVQRDGVWALPIPAGGVEAMSVTAVGGTGFAIRLVKQRGEDSDGVIRPFLRADLYTLAGTLVGEGTPTPSTEHGDLDQIAHAVGTMLTSYLSKAQM